MGRLPQRLPQRRRQRRRQRLPQRLSRVKRPSSNKTANASAVLKVTRATERKQLRKWLQHAPTTKSQRQRVWLVLVVTHAKTTLPQKMGHHRHPRRKRKIN